MAEDRAALLAQVADEFMENGGRFPARLPAGCSALNASFYPESPDEPREVHFSMTWASVTLVCVRSLEGYSIAGGLHREEGPGHA
jgi:hypothetical protein